MNCGKFEKSIYIFVITILFASCYGFGADIQSLVPEAEKIVSQGLKDSDASTKISAIEVISTTQKVKFAGRVAVFLKDPVMPVRFAAALAIGDLQYKKSEKLLHSLLNDPDINVRIAGAYALCKLGQEQYLPVIQASTSQDDPTVQANSAMLLGKLKSRESLPILYKLKDDKNSTEMIAYNAAEAIARIGDEKIYNKLWALLISAYVDDRCIGIIAMGALGGAKGASALSTMLDDEVVEVRLSAAEQLGLLGDPSGQLVVLEYFAQSDSKDEKQAADSRNTLAAMAIGAIRSKKLAEYLPKLLKNDSAMVRLAAAKSVFLLAGGD
ncbi:MAG: HEAT repeat domain-containing protein [Phycisphaerae bacterium]|nr:HEAT repeat domain-containing protein [Phycisphaerae bacterium]